MPESRPVAPNLFIIGAAKAASSSLHRWLAAHPDVVASRSDETRFLMDPDEPLARAKGFAQTGLEGYAAHYPEAAQTARYVLDVTPMYYYQATARRVIPTLPDARVMFIARRPGARLKSLYDYAGNNIGVLPKGITFAEFVDEVEKGAASSVIGAYPMMRDAIEHCRYAKHLRFWIDALGRERVRILIFEEVTRSPRATMTDLCAWLDLSAAIYDGYIFSKENQSYRINNRILHRVARAVKRRLPHTLRKAGKDTYMALNTRHGKGAVSAEDGEAMRRVDALLAEDADDLAVLLGRETLWPGIRVSERAQPQPT